MVAAPGLAGGLLLAHPQLGPGAVCAEPRALLWVRSLFSLLDFVGLLLAPSSHVQRSEQQLRSLRYPGLGGGGMDPCSPACSGNPTLLLPVALAPGRASTPTLRAGKCWSVVTWSPGCWWLVLGAGPTSVQPVLGCPEAAPGDRHRSAAAPAPCREQRSCCPWPRGVSGGCSAGALRGIVRVPGLSPAAHGGCSWIIPAACWGLVRCERWAAEEGQGEPCFQHAGCRSPAAGGAVIKTPVRPGREWHGAACQGGTARAHRCEQLKEGRAEA